MKAIIFGGSKGIGAALKVLLEKDCWEVQDVSRSSGVDLRFRYEGFVPEEEFDVYAYCVGIAGFNGLDWPQMQDMLNLNLIQAMNTSKLVKARHYIFIGSTAAFRTFKGHGIYAATKAGLLAYARVLRAEGKKVSVVSPSSTDTGFWTGEENCGMYKPKVLMQPEMVALAIKACIDNPACIEEMVITA